MCVNIMLDFIALA